MQENKSVFVHFFCRATNSTSVSCIHPVELYLANLDGSDKITNEYVLSLSKLDEAV
jgi:hypothetical protein